MSTYGIFLPCDGSEPMPISVGDYQHIQQLVGGPFDAVRKDFDPSQFNDPINILGDGKRDPFVAVAYVHDEGILLDLPPNPMASIMLDREIFGPAVIVSGSSPNGFYDGDNHDLPEWFANAVFQGGLKDVADELMEEAVEVSSALMLAYEDGLFDTDQMYKVVQMMASEDPKYFQTLENVIAIASAYALGRKHDAIPKFDRSEYVKFEQSLELTDDEIENFWKENQ